MPRFISFSEPEEDNELWMNMDHILRIEKPLNKERAIIYCIDGQEFRIPHEIFEKFFRDVLNS